MVDIQRNDIDKNVPLISHNLMYIQFINEMHDESHYQNFPRKSKNLYIHADAELQLMFSSHVMKFKCLPNHSGEVARKSQ